GRQAVVVRVAVGRVAEDEVVPALVERERTERVLLDDARAADAQLLDVPVDRAGGLAVVLDEGRACGATRERLEAHRAGAGEEVEDVGAVDRADQVERGLADAVGGRPRLASLRREDPRPAVLAADDPHATASSKARNASSPKSTKRTSS